MKIRGMFTGCLQDAQELGSDDEHMVSRVEFVLEVDGRRHDGLHCVIKQIAGGRFEVDPIEVGPPVGYKGPFNYNAFRDEVERYYRSLVGASGSAIQISPSARNVRMTNNYIEARRTFEFDADGSRAGGW